jgi:hypothetical protein
MTSISFLSIPEVFKTSNAARKHKSAAVSLGEHTLLYSMPVCSISFEILPISDKSALLTFCLGTQEEMDKIFRGRERILYKKKPIILRLI